MAKVRKCGLKVVVVYDGKEGIFKAQQLPKYIPNMTALREVAYQTTMYRFNATLLSKNICS